MPVKTPLKGVTIQRVIDGVRRNLHPPIGKPFDFTDLEVRQISKAQEGLHPIHALFAPDDPDQPRVPANTPENLADSIEHSNPVGNSGDAEAAEAGKEARAEVTDKKPAALKKPGLVKRPATDEDDGL